MQRLWYKVACESFIQKYEPLLTKAKSELGKIADQVWVPQNLDSFVLKVFIIIERPS